MKNSFNLMYCAVLLTGAALLFPGPLFGGSCCGGSSGSGLVLPKCTERLIEFSFNSEKYDGFWNQDGKYLADPPASSLLQYRVNLGFAQRISTNWQASISLPYVFNKNKYSGLASSTNGVGDITPGVWYEALDDASAWKIRGLRDLVPSVLIGPSLLIPTGVSPYDNVKSSFDVTGRGFYRLDGNLLVSKTLHPFSTSLSMSYGTPFKRPINREYGRYVAPYNKMLGDRFSGSLSVAYIYYMGSAGDALTPSVNYSHLQESDATIGGVRYVDSGLRKDAFGASLVYSGIDHSWTIKTSWNHALRVNGWGNNFPATDVFTLGGSYAFR